METKLIEIDYSPRAAFRDYHSTDKRFCLTVAHRRAGKTVARINKLIQRAAICQLDDPRFGYLAPYYVQAKDIAWAYLKRYAHPIIALGGKVNEGELSVTFPHNNAQIRLYGAENADRLRGVYFDGLVADEAQDIAPSVLTQIIMPSLADRKGWLDMSGTPKGWANMLGQTYKRAQTDEDWFVQILRASETGLIDVEELAMLKRNMLENEYAQEFECSFDAAISGAYFAEHILDARKSGRIGRVAADPLMTYRLYFDIGGTGSKADAASIWVAQFIGREIRVLDYYEAVGQPLAAHVTWMRSKGYTPDKAQIWLPHDGRKHDSVFDVTYESALREVGYTVTTVPNQGAGAALQRIQAARRLFNSMWFDETGTSSGLEALSAYHEKRDEKRNIGLGPNHDWSSHASDAFGLMAVAYEEPDRLSHAPLKYLDEGIV